MKNQLYPGIAFSPQATLTGNIGEADTIIKVSDVSAFPEAPNLATIGIDADGETILYAAKTEDALSGCQRGVEGTAKAWSAGEIIGRNFTAKDHNDLINDLVEIGDTAEKKAPLGLIGGDTARCKTNEEIDAAISTRYSNLENCMFKNFTLLIDSTGLDVPTGNWSATIYRAATNYGYLIASSYASTGHPVSILTRSYYNGAWAKWYKLATTSDTAPRGLIDGQGILCNTDDDINAAIISEYSAMKDRSAKFFELLINANNLQLDGGYWLALMYRVSENHGFLIATRYTAKHPIIHAKSLYGGNWTDFYSMAFATPPTKYDLAVTDDFQKLTNNANWYAKDQFGRVTVCVYVTPVSGTLAANDFEEITTLPEGFRPKTSITFLATDPTTSHITVFSFRNNGLVVSGTTESQVKQLVGEFTFIANE